MDDETEENPFTGQPVGLLEPQGWIIAPETVALVAALQKNGAEIRFVGGCVRDAVARRPIADIDLATPAPPEVVMALLETAGFRAIPTGLQHGTVTAVVGGRHYEITTLRRDVETFGRRARVEFTDDWIADAARRDFTFNALSATPDGRIFDPFNGLADLAAGRVRFVGEPTRRIKEDILRILRFYRFYAHFGRPPIDVAALAACRALAPSLTELSGERVQAEMKKLLAAPDPASILLIMQGGQALSHILPEMSEIGVLRQLVFFETRGLIHPLVKPDVLRRLAATLPADPDAVARVAQRLRLAKVETERLTGLAAPVERPDQWASEEETRRLLYRLGAERFRDLLLLGWARGRATGTVHTSGESERWRALLTAAEVWTPHPLPINGRDVLDLGVEPGPEVGALLGQMEAWWIERAFEGDREAALERLRVIVCRRD